jgi:hypothetical protein
MNDRTRAYGNDEDSTRFVTTIGRLGLRPQTSIRLRFDFQRRMRGRGANDENCGQVSGATITLSEAHARKLALALLAYVDSQNDEAERIQFAARVKSAATA